MAQRANHSVCIVIAVYHLQVTNYLTLDNLNASMRRSKSCEASIWKYAAKQTEKKP